jgi:long-chain acyl-CoA synthetase
MATKVENMMEEHAWLRSYPPGVPARIDPERHASVRDILEGSVARFAGRPAFTCMGRTITYRELDRLSRDLAAWLQSHAGLARGARVALMMPNVLQYPVAIFAVLRAGLTVVNCNPLYTPRELDQQLADSGAEAIVILENFARTLEQALPRTKVRTVITTGLGDLLGFPRSAVVNFMVKHVKRLVPPWRLEATAFRDALAAGTRLPLDEPPLGPEDVAFLQYTGGTTGISKGAMLTHRNIVANLMQCEAWWGTTLSDREIVITALPLYHIFALTGNCLVFMNIGAHDILITNPRDLRGFVKELGKWRFTCITGVNTLFNALLNTPGFEKLDFSRMRLALGGGMAVQRSVAERWKAVTGQPLVEAYGLTETSPGACINPVGPGFEFNGTAGLPIPSTIVTIRDEAGRELLPGETGEICIAGPQVMKGYWNRPDETAIALRDGWLYTGDLGTIDADGYFSIVDRKKDMILVSGFNVYPNEVEDVVAMLPGVGEVCAVAAPDEHSGEVVRVVIVPRDPALTKEQVVAHCRKYLTGYKVPKIVEFWKELPKTNVGKVLRREVKTAPVKA